MVYEDDDLFCVCSHACFAFALKEKTRNIILGFFILINFLEFDYFHLKLCSAHKGQETFTLRKPAVTERVILSQVQV